MRSKTPTFPQPDPNTDGGEWNQSSNAREDVMMKVVQCDCGYVAKADSDEDLIAQVQAHAEEVHI